jgi:hypothetical protein
MFLILRTEGGRDLLKPIADRLMGKRARKARQLQKYWKDKFKRYVLYEGLEEVARKLRLWGSKRATLANVRYWASPDSIKPQNKDDFFAIMRLIQETQRADLFWNVASFIDRAHKKAGKVISRILLQKVAGVTAYELAGIGRMDIQLTENGGGKVTLLRIVDVSPESYLVDENRIGLLVKSG